MNPVLIAKLEAYAVGLIVAVLTAAVFGYKEHHAGYLTGKAEIQTILDAFKADVKAAGMQAEADKLKTEKENAARLANSFADRATALQLLSVAQAQGSSSRRASANNPTAPAGSSQICFDSTGYNTAFREFGERLDRFIQIARGLVGEGAAAQIDAKSLLSAWPQSKQ